MPTTVVIHVGTIINLLVPSFQSLQFSDKKDN